jgi:peroxiredoxin
MTMANLRTSWRTGHLVIVVLLTVPGFLMVLRHWGYLPGAPLTVPPERQSRKIVAPEFSLPDIDGNIRHLSSFRGRVVLLNFWATWCPPCRAEMAALEVLYQSYKHRGFEVVAVASDVQGVEVVQPFMSQHQLTFLPLLDSATRVTRTYGVTTLPTSYLLDREGRLVTVEIGGRDWATAESRALITSLLESDQQADGPPRSRTTRGRSSGTELRMAAGQ